MCNVLELLFLGWLGLVWARDPGLTEATGWLGYLDPPIQFLKVEGKHKPWHSPSSSNLERVPAAFPPLRRVLVLDSPFLGGCLGGSMVGHLQKKKVFPNFVDLSKLFCERLDNKNF